MRAARLRPWTLSIALIACMLLLPLAAPSAHAKLTGKEWKAVQAKYKTLFAQRGNSEAKLALLEEVASDGQGRAWRLMADALFKEVQVLSSIEKELADASAEHSELLQKGLKGYTAADEGRTKELATQMKDLEGLLADERKAADGIVAAVAKGPEALRKNILKRAKAGGDWPYRAAAVRVAALTLGEKESWGHLVRTLGKDADPRVRMAALDALGNAPEKWEDLVIGRLADPDWSVVLRASQIATARKLHRAVPHLINGLSAASPRLAQGMGKALRELTGENFEPYADVWSKWWADHKEDFEKDVEVKTGKKPEFPRIHFYGVEIKSDRVLFIIDVSASMKKETKNDNPKDRWKPPPTVTGGNKPPPPPPPPEEILSGPKIDVAKHELKKAIEKMPKEYTFNIIAYNQGAKAWQKSLVKANKKNKEAAFAWIRALKAHGSTFTDGALRMGFEMAGLINFDDKYPNIALDTIVLLSDGAPTDTSFPVAKLMDFKIILQHVREWNKKQQVVVHCIAVDMQPGNEFMAKLAEENGGTFVDR
ncbi:MAG: HEAT repeat domain-containing protein [Planctomycetota bacterium]|nr:HEAT repeat domain-containing protein [Planctomycetota bacterium]